ncbi:MAG: ribosome-associated translation inhibitor RaiA [Candidatus Marinimicrobia bacterium]|jgi:putative sigma-54 modulation protein|nr:ribosomal subunit interface protein [Candidatus Neomarinimicrobiota bacterium]MDP6456154.1 ribosome-associated translation inhibitor RaiA [Candidatus Neomarinimicrobiota bacterium]MDP6593688.1 ribosome-associated translation inhibitor RaiA [Candidatus Neomarinimicrobiota bacterium]MDP6836365.1 ribosome-associated translation inhibitor RaiA [Candidatus Neomarinimicrobiota bacterium]|tara:strand:- start:914 stop:1204 length:291 start_codon:yes stop_codon:yes gene_type:complete
MNIEFTSRNFNTTEQVREYALKRLSKIDRYVSKPIACRVTFVSDNSDRRVEIGLSVPGKKLFVKESSGDMMKSIDGAVDKMISRIVKFKETRYSHI